MKTTLFVIFIQILVNVQDNFNCSSIPSFEIIKKIRNDAVLVGLNNLHDLAKAVKQKRVYSAMRGKLS
jgi:hypothetical protein